MDLGPALLIGFAWLVLNAIRKAGSKPPGTGTPPRRPPGRSALRHDACAPGRPTAAGRAAQAASAGHRRGRDPAGGEPARGAPPGAGPDARAGRRRPVGRAPDRRLPPAEEVEERESLEVSPEVRSLETRCPGGRRGSRSTRTTRRSGSWRGGSRRPRRRRGRSRKRTTRRSTRGSGRSRRTRPRRGATRARSCGMRWCGGRFSGRRCRCGREGEERERIEAADGLPNFFSYASIDSRRSPRRAAAAPSNPRVTVRVPSRSLYTWKKCSISFR